MIKVYGRTVDDETRCIHYHKDEDIIAIKFKCCNKYYPCYQCHSEAESHVTVTWPESEWDTKAILCGHCKEELTINEYLVSTHCPHCHALFNPRCSKHYHLYFNREEGHEQ
ncbi:CHY zinc finger protein [Macrococcus lamae]|uniref:CHY-type domain-containing protein n=1 Tax=Macrococcus lamae TaxID=198484 RepID=A0A4R6BVT2_9STAP|nr:CHY zinc finger protein [Macrococcus lamae]TDM12275.1 hypothetical protein ERX29_04205 [Macrococcus lamae]